MLITAWKQLFKTPFFVASLVWTVIINSQANYWLFLGSLTNWGKLPVPDLYVWHIIHIPNSLTYTCMATDILATTMIIGYLTALLGPGAAVKEVMKGKLAPISEELLNTWPARWLPMRQKSNCKRAGIMCLVSVIVFGVPTVLLLALTIGSGSWAGRPYLLFKAIWASFVAMFIYTFAHVAATSTDKFTDDMMQGHSLLANQHGPSAVVVGEPVSTFAQPPAGQPVPKVGQPIPI